MAGGLFNWGGGFGLLFLLVAHERSIYNVDVTIFASSVPTSPPFSDSIYCKLLGSEEVANTLGGKCHILLKQT